MRSIDRSEIVSAWSKNQCRPVDRDILVDPLERVERARDRLVVGCVQPPGPIIRGKDAHHLFELALHFRRHVGAGLAEILEIGGGEDQHLAAAVVAEIIRALLVFRGLRPVEEIVLLALGFLREQVVGDADGELAFGGELFDDRVVFRVVLEAAAGVDRAGHAEPVQLAHEMPRRVDLIVERQFRTPGEGRVENTGIRLRQQQPGRIVVAVAHDFAARRLRRLRGVADRAQRRLVEQRAIVEMQEEDRRIGSHRVELVDCRQTASRRTGAR